MAGAGNGDHDEGRHRRRWDKSGMNALGSGGVAVVGAWRMSPPHSPMEYTTYMCWASFMSVQNATWEDRVRVRTTGDSVGRS